MALRRHPAQRPLVFDLVYSRMVTSHFEGGSALWNAGYPDGHAAGFQDATLDELFRQGLDASSDWAVFNQLVRPHLPGATVGAAP